MASRVFTGCRVMFAAAKAGASKSTAAAEVKKTVRSSSAAGASKPVTEKTAPSKPSGIQKPCPVSPALHCFVGAPEVSRAEAVKMIWDYIKLHNLQNPANKREILPDNKLKTIFEGKDKVGMMEISKLLSPHFLKTNPL